MARGVKIDNKKIQEVMASYALTNSYNATAKECDISDKSVKKIIQEHSEEFTKVFEHKKEEFVEQANKIIDKGMALLNRRFDTALNNQDEIEELINLVFNNDDLDQEDRLTKKEKVDIAKKLGRLELNGLSEITTAIGTLYDKRALAKGDATANSSISIKMTGEVKELSK